MTTSSTDNLERDRTAVSAARSRGEARLVAWIQEGTVVAGKQLATAWGVQPQSVDAARKRGELFSIRVKGKHWYPAEALNLERPTLAAITKELGSADSSSKLLFLLRQHGALKGKTPAQAITAGQFEDVLRLAEHWSKEP